MITDAYPPQNNAGQVSSAKSQNDGYGNVHLEDSAQVGGDPLRKSVFPEGSMSMEEDPNLHPLFAMEATHSYKGAWHQGSQDMTDVDALLWNYGLAANDQQDEENEYRRREEQRLGEDKGCRAICFKIARSVQFKVFFGLLIILNFISVAIEAQLAVQLFSDPGDETVKKTLATLVPAEHVFVALFFVEIVIRIFGNPVHIWQDAWLMIDTIIVFISVVDIWLLGIFFASSSALRTLSALRMLRALRAVRIIRLFRLVNKLQVLAEALGEAFLSIISIIVVMVFFMWIASILFTSTIGCLQPGDYHPQDDMDPSTPRIDELFRTVGTTLLTMSLVSLQSTEWGPPVLMPLLFSSDPETIMFGVFFVSFAILILLCVLNLVTGIFIRTILQVASRNRAVIDRESLFSSNNSLNQLKDVYRALDGNGDGMLSLAEFKNGLEQKPELCKRLGLDAERAASIFEELQYGSDNLVKIDEFLMGIIKMTRSSRSIDMISIDFNQRKTIRDIMTVKRVYHQDEKLMCHYMIQVDEFLSNISEEVKSLSGELAKDFDKVEVLESLLTTMSDPDLEATADLEGRYNFMTRLAALKADVKELDTNAENEGITSLQESQRDQASSLSSQQAPLSNATVGAAWRTIMQEDVLPWLRHELAESAKKRAIKENLAAQNATTSHNMPSYGKPGQERKLHYKHSGPCFLSSTLTAVEESSPWHNEPAHASQHSTVERGPNTTNFGYSSHTGNYLDTIVARS